MRDKGFFGRLLIAAAVITACLFGLRPETALAAGLVVETPLRGFAGLGLGDAGVITFVGLGMVINLENLAAIFKTFLTTFNKAFSGVKPMWEQVAMKVPSTTAENVYAWLGAFPRMREWIGDRQYKNLRTHDFSIKNKEFEATIEVPKKNIEDDSVGVFTPVVAELGRAAATHPDELVFALLAAGLTTLCYDGQYFFDTDHPVGSGVVSNNLGGAGTAWYLMDTTRALMPLIFQRRKEPEFVQMTDPNSSEHVFKTGKHLYGVDDRKNVGFGLWQLAITSKQTLDAAGYAAARAAMMEFKDDEGRPLGITPSLLVVPPSLEGEARELLLSERTATGATNKWRNSAEMLVVPWL